MKMGDSIIFELAEQNGEYNLLRRPLSRETVHYNPSDSYSTGKFVCISNRSRVDVRVFANTEGAQMVTRQAKAMSPSHDTTNDSSVSLGVGISQEAGENIAKHFFETVRVCTENVCKTGDKFSDAVLQSSINVSMGIMKSTENVSNAAIKSSENVSNAAIKSSENVSNAAIKSSENITRAMIHGFGLIVAALVIAVSIYIKK